MGLKSNFSSTSSNYLKIVRELFGNCFGTYGSNSRALQAKNTNIQNQIKELSIENKQLLVLNKKLSNEVSYLKKDLKTKHLK